MDTDIFSVSRMRQMLALLDRGPMAVKEGDVLPRGWHNAMFNVATPSSKLRPDGFAGLGVELSQTDLIRLMFGGRRIRFNGDIIIGAPARRVNRLMSSETKQGRSGRLMVVTVQRDIYCGEGELPVVEEQQDYILREAAAAASEPLGPAADPAPGSTPFVADEQMLFRYCALTFNTHRIHYDAPYAMAVEGYPALVVNGNLTALMLSELYRARSGAEPNTFVSRNVRPLFCRQENRLRCEPGDDSWRVWAENAQGQVALEAVIT